MSKWNPTTNPSAATDTPRVPSWERLIPTLAPLLANPYYLMNYYPPQPQLVISPSGRSYYDFESRRWKPIPNGSGDSWGNFWFGFIIAMLVLGLLYWALKQ